MTQEDKELLLKDLCARLPYGVICLYKNENRPLFCVRPTQYYKIALDNAINVKHNGVENCVIEEVKPYLFPLSSLTEEQRNDISKLLIDTQKEYSPFGKLNMNGCDNLFICTVQQANVLIDYCLTYHLDINGLIEKGLAIDATGLNIY